MMHPKYKRYAKKALLFALIWWISAVVYSILEFGLLGDLAYYPSTKNKYDFNNSIIYSSTAAFVIGFIHGWVEVSWLSKKFTDRPLWLKMVLKVGFYLSFIVLFLLVLTLITNATRFGASIFSKEVLDSLVSFFDNFAFWSVVIFIATAMLIAMLFSEATMYLGDSLFANFLFGKYHTPKREDRIFMFLDMKSSTTIAEAMGHQRYFELLKAYYADMTNPILETSGEIYQYVGDEIVVTWPLQLGVFESNCLECFRRLNAVFQSKKVQYQKQFGVVPEFKAGFHQGEVTTGQIGILKKDIIYTGDVLNTAARIQAQCNAYGVKALLSEDIVQQLPSDPTFQFVPTATLKLRGKHNSIQLFSLAEDVTEAKDL